MTNPALAMAEVKRIFRTAYDLYEQYQTPPAYFDNPAWYEAGERLKKAVDVFQSGDFADFAQELLFCVYQQIERASKAAFEAQERRKETIGANRLKM